MRNASGHNYWNSSFIMDVAMGQIPRSTERISSYQCFLHCFLCGMHYRAADNLAYPVLLAVYAFPVSFPANLHR